MHRYPRERILNLDETNWNPVAAGVLTWAVKEAESANCQIDNSEKESVIVIDGIDAASTNRPLTIMGKWKAKDFFSVSTPSTKSERPFHNQD
jgi:hypothetical protein